jgi:addiction module HigA family antidote
MKTSRRLFAVHPGEILKTEFMEPMGVSAYALAKALHFPGIYDVVRGDRAISADTAIRLGKYFGLPPQFWMNLQNDFDLRIAERSGIGKGIKPREVDDRDDSADGERMSVRSQEPRNAGRFARHDGRDSHASRTERG